MDRIEKIVWIVAGAAIVIVVAFIFLGPLKSEISMDAALKDFDEANKHLARDSRGRFIPPPPERVQKRTQSFAAASGGSARAGVSQPSAPPAEGGDPRVAAAAASGAPDSPYTPREEMSQPDPSTSYAAGEAAPVFIPQSMAEKFKHFDDLRELGMTAAGEDYITPSGEQAYLLRGINEDSLLSTRLGFMPGDVIISVNGYAPSRGNARQLYETLRGAKDFTVVVERGGQRQTMQYHIR